MNPAFLFHSYCCLYFNRVEFKLNIEKTIYIFIIVYILTEWNLNSSATSFFTISRSVYILTEWNLNKFVCEYFTNYKSFIF